MLWFVILSLGFVLLFKWVPVPITPLMAIRYLETDSSKTLEHDWVSLDQISKNLQLAVICSEDQNFLNHNGFDYEAIKKVIDNNKKGRNLRGASTISQQTAKNVFLWPQRSWLRKGMEVYFTFLIEVCWSKERIIEVYLNSIEMGTGIYGAEAASEYWFKKSAVRLSQQEAAAIAAILPNPRKYKANPVTQYIASRKQWIVKQMRYFGLLEFTQKDDGKQKIKAELYRLCLEFVENRFQTIQNTIHEIQVSLTSETKSSAGDKHETGRAMLQLEREKAGNQLAEVQKVREALSKIDITKTSSHIGLGSLVYTSQANYFIAISAGALKVDNDSFYAISPNTPIGKLLIGKTVGNQIEFRNLSFKIIDLI